MKIFKLIICSFLSICLAAVPYIASAQIGPDPGCNPDEPCPIDSNVYVLIIAVVLIAGYKYLSTLKRSSIA